MAAHVYKTLQAPAEGLYKEKGSKFLSFAYPVDTEKQIQEKIALLKKDYFDARHHCFAWILGAQKEKFRAYDDGEPNHSAGDPILGQIKSRDLTYTLIVVVRYFGGIKLGVGGLVSAYKAAALDALERAVIIEKEIVATISLLYDYDATPEVMKLVKEFELHILHQAFEARCQLQVSLKEKYQDRFYERIKLLQALRLKIEVAPGP
jgi:uncharacterized YigZ family protein